MLYTPNVWLAGSSLSHFDAAAYLGTSNFLMRPTAVIGAGLDAILPNAPYGPISKEIIGMLSNIGYIVFNHDNR